MHSLHLTLIFQLTVYIRSTINQDVYGDFSALSFKTVIKRQAVSPFLDQMGDLQPFMERCGENRNLPILPDFDECYDDIYRTRYLGSKSTTVTGKICRHWSKTNLKPGRKSSSEYDQGLTKNHCRQPDGKPFLWCFTQQGKKEKCDVPLCSKYHNMTWIRNEIKGNSSELFPPTAWEAYIKFSSTSELACTGGVLLHSRWFLIPRTCYNINNHTGVSNLRWLQLSYNQITSYSGYRIEDFVLVRPHAVKVPGVPFCLPNQPELQVLRDYMSVYGRCYMPFTVSARDYIHQVECTQLVFEENKILATAVSPLHRQFLAGGPLVCFNKKRVAWVTLGLYKHRNAAAANQIEFTRITTPVAQRVTQLVQEHFPPPNYPEYSESEDLMMQHVVDSPNDYILPFNMTWLLLLLLAAFGVFYARVMSQYRCARNFFYRITCSKNEMG